MRDLMRQQPQPLGGMRRERPRPEEDVGPYRQGLRPEDSTDAISPRMQPNAREVDSAVGPGVESKWARQCCNGTPFTATTKNYGTARIRSTAAEPSRTIAPTQR